MCLYGESGHSGESGRLQGIHHIHVQFNETWRGLPGSIHQVSWLSMDSLVMIQPHLKCIPCDPVSTETIPSPILIICRLLSSDSIPNHHVALVPSVFGLATPLRSTHYCSFADKLRLNRIIGEDNSFEMKFEIIFFKFLKIQIWVASVWYNIANFRQNWAIYKNGAPGAFFGKLKVRWRVTTAICC